jgi:Transcriptional regulator
MGDEQAGQSKTLVRGLSILRACATSRHGLTLVEIAEHTELAPSTVHRLLTTLEGAGIFIGSIQRRVVGGSRWPDSKSAMSLSDHAIISRNF